MKNDIPVTAAVRLLRQHHVFCEPFLYTYEEHGGTRHAAEALGVSEHCVIKTLVFETENRKPLLVLMHGDCEVSTKQLARELGTKRVTPCNSSGANRHTGYTVGGISPFGTRSQLPVCAESTIFSLPAIYVNGGKRGFLIRISPSVLSAVLDVSTVNVALCGDRLTSPHPA